MRSRKTRLPGSLALALVPVLVAVLVVLAGTGAHTPTSTVPHEPAPPPRLAATTNEIGEIAEGYVKLVLAAGRYDEDYVDSYFGPPAWREASRSIERSEIAPEGRRLRGALDALPEETGDRMDALRRAFLGAHLDALVAVMERLDGYTLAFDEEVAALYDVVAPPFDETDNAAALAELDGLLPGEGSLDQRYLSWTMASQVPADRLDGVLKAALAEGRLRTLAFVDLPPEEEVELEYVTGEPWGAFNDYRGGYRSVVQVNVDGRMPIGRALVIACHEAYPGHHVFNVLQERHLVEGRGWVEFSVHPLYSPQSVIAEGTACQATAIVFPGEERDAFLADTLFPLAGLKPEDAAMYGRIVDLVERLDRARTEAAHRLLAPDGNRLGAASWLARHSYLSLRAALSDLAFARRYGSYTITYSAGPDLVRTWLDANAHEGGPSEQELFARLLLEPRLPRDLLPDGSR